MILYYLWRRGLLSNLDAEKVRFFFGWTGDAEFLSRKTPLVRTIHLGKALISASYADSLARWLQYRVELYDGLRG